MKIKWEKNILKMFCDISEKNQDCELTNSPLSSPHLPLHYMHSPSPWHDQAFELEPWHDEAMDPSSATTTTISLDEVKLSAGRLQATAASSLYIC